MSQKRASSDIYVVEIDDDSRIPFKGSLDFNFGNFENCLSHSPIVIQSLKDDCLHAFTSPNTNEDEEKNNDDDIDIESTSYHNKGSTYFQRSSIKPRCNLEALALSIFQFHTKDAVFDKNRSGAEWWTQVVDSEDDIGFHWDRDYGYEGLRGLNLYPHLATVTYLTDIGGPTIIVDKIGCENSDDSHSGHTGKNGIILSKPSVGKHIKFDGRLLHAAPSSLILGDSNQLKNEIKNEIKNEKEVVNEDKKCNSNKSNKRITFLVNIWLNHIPMQARAFPKNSLSQFSLLLPSSELSFFHQIPVSLNNIHSIQENKNNRKNKDNNSHLKRTNSIISELNENKNETDLKKFEASKTFNVSTVTQIAVKSELKVGILDLHRWNFVNGGLKYSVSIPLPAKNRIMRIMTESNAFQLNYSNSNVQGIVDCIDDSNAYGDDSMRLEKKRTRYWKPFHIYRS